MKDRKILIGLIIVAVLAFLFLTSKVAFSSLGLWQDLSIGIKDTKINAVCFDKKNALIGYIGSGKAIYKTEDGGKYWKAVLNLRGKYSAINYLLIHSVDSKIIYAATDNGLYRSSDSGKKWQRIFKGKNYQQRSCLSVALNDKQIFLATKSGLFISKDAGKTWVEHLGRIENLEVSSIVLFNNLVYLATSKGVFKSENSGENFKKVYSVLDLQEDTEGTADESDDEEANSTIKIRQIILNEDKANKIYLASDEGVITSLDSAQTWQKISNIGLISQNINSICVSGNRLFCATDEGVFEFYRERWHQVYEGLIAKTINFLCQDAQGDLWAASNKGVHKLGAYIKEEANAEIVMTKKLLDNFRNEPSVQQIQQQAVKYAEVQPEKIEAWRKAAAKGAWLPKVSIDADGDKNITTSDSIWGSYSSGGSHHLGPDDKTFYNNFGWSASLTWDLSELVWNPDQTSIDVRSRLMVELRGDILDEVTRLYFERRRLQVDYLSIPSKDVKGKIEQSLRVDELTASIDALTGGYLSRMIYEN